MQRTDVKTEDIAEHIVNSQKETKENKPAAKNKVRSIFTFSI